MSRRLSNLFATLVVALPAFLAASGCSKITKDNADKVTTGMSEKEVTALLGSETTHILTIDTKHAFWKDGSNTITVTFVKGKVVTKAFADASGTSPSGKAAASDAAAVTKSQSSNGPSSPPSMFDSDIMKAGSADLELARRMQEEDRIQQKLAEKEAEYHRQAREALQREFAPK